jgi:hypothetical protein
MLPHLMSVDWKKVTFLDAEDKRSSVPQEYFDKGSKKKTDLCLIMSMCCLLGAKFVQCLLGGANVHQELAK